MNTKDLLPSEKAPEFLELTANRGSTVILYFYPRDFTPGCTTEACNFRDLYPRITEKGAVVLGVSPDSLESHEKFIASHGLPYALVADPDHKICRAYGVWKEKNMYGKKRMGVERSTFIIDGDGYVKKVYRKVRVKNHVNDILESL